MKGQGDLDLSEGSDLDAAINKQHQPELIQEVLNFSETGEVWSKKQNHVDKRPGVWSWLVAVLKMVMQY